MSYNAKEKPIYSCRDESYQKFVKITVLT